MQVPERVVGDWGARAACRGMDPNIWFPEHVERDSNKRALEVCNSCPVQRECLDWAVNHFEYDGIWGGLTPKQRSNGVVIRICGWCSKEYPVQRKAGQPKLYCSDECTTQARYTQRLEHDKRTGRRSGRFLEMGHGLVSRYQRGCRCAACKRASREARQVQRAKQKNEEEPAES